MFIYNTRLIGLSILLDRSNLLGEEDKVVFRWEPRTVFPLSAKNVQQIEDNCKTYIIGDGLSQRLYPKNELEKKPITLPASNKGRYVTIEKALAGEF